jgi:hypothetical protein
MIFQRAGLGPPVATKSWQGMSSKSKGKKPGPVTGTQDIYKKVIEK